MTLTKIITGTLKTNCYIIKTNKNNCLIIDPGSDFHKINDHIVKNGLNPMYILLTHGHYDHIGAVPKLKETYPNTKIAISKEDEECLLDGNKSLANIYGNYIQKPISSDITIRDNFKISIDDINITCILTPGHTVGGTCYLINDELLLTGDTLFKNSVGRTDLYGGNQQILNQSIRKIYNLFNPSIRKNILIYPGHWLSSNLEKELHSNTYLSFLNNI